MKRLLEGLHAVHTSRLQYETTIVSIASPAASWLQLTFCPQDYFGDEPRRPPIDTHHPAIRTHPVTGLKSLNVNLAYCTGFAELKKAESDALMQFLNLLIHSSDDHYVRWKWQPGSIALWDNVKTTQRSRRKLPIADKQMHREYACIVSYQATTPRVQGEVLGPRSLEKNVRRRKTSQKD